MNNIVFNLKKAKVSFIKKIIKSVEKKVVPKQKKDFRYVITRHMGVASKIILTVYDKWEMRYVYHTQAPIEKGYDVTQDVKHRYRNHKFVDNIVKDEALFEF